MTITADDLNKAFKSTIASSNDLPPDWIFVSISLIPSIVKHAAELNINTETVEQLKSFIKDEELEK